MAQHVEISSTIFDALRSWGGMAAVSSGVKRYDVLNSMYSDTCSSLIMRVPERGSGCTQLQRTLMRDAFVLKFHTCTHTEA